MALTKQVMDIDDAIERMSKKLQSLAKSSYDNATIKSKVYGVFSLDDLERQMKDSLVRGQVGIGISYEGAQRDDIQSNTSNTTMNPGQGRASLNFYFLIVVAVASNDCCEGKFNGTNLLQVLRRGIFAQQTMDEDREHGVDPAIYRTWDFVKEGPEISASNDAMLYYSQVWRANAPVTGKK